MKKEFLGFDSYKMALAKVVKFIDEYNLNLKTLEVKEVKGKFNVSFTYGLGLR